MGRISGDRRLPFFEQKLPAMPFEEQLKLLHKHHAEPIDSPLRKEIENTLILSNKGYIIYVVQKIVARQSHLFPEACICGCEGFLNGIRTFDFERNTRLTTACKMNIVREVMLFVYSEAEEYGCTMRANTIKKIKTIGKLNCDTLEEQIKVIENLLNLDHDMAIRLTELKKSISLQYPRFTERKRPLGEEIAQKTFPSPEDACRDREFINAIRYAILEKLTEKESLIIRKYFGLVGEEVLSYREIGQELGCSCTTIQNILYLIIKPKLRDALLDLAEEYHLKIETPTAKTRKMRLRVLQGGM